MMHLTQNDYEDSLSKKCLLMQYRMRCTGSMFSFLDRELLTRTTNHNLRISVQVFLWIKSFYFIKRVKGLYKGQRGNKRGMRVPSLIMHCYFQKTKLRELLWLWLLGRKTLERFEIGFGGETIHSSWS